MGADVIERNTTGLERMAVRFGRQAKSTAQTTQRGSRQSMSRLPARRLGGPRPQQPSCRNGP